MCVSEAKQQHIIHNWWFLCENKALRYLNNVNLCERREYFVLRSVHRREQYIITRIKIYITALSVPLQESPSFLPWILLKVNEYKSILGSDLFDLKFAIWIGFHDRLSAFNEYELQINARGNWENNKPHSTRFCLGFKIRRNFNYSSLI